MAGRCWCSFRDEALGGSRLGPEPTRMAVRALALALPAGCDRADADEPAQCGGCLPLWRPGGAGGTQAAGPERLVCGRWPRGTQTALSSTVSAAPANLTQIPRGWRRHSHLAAGWAPAKAHDHITAGTQHHPHQLGGGGNLPMDQHPHDHDGDDADVAPEGIGQAEGNQLNGLSQQHHGQAVGQQNHGGGQGSGHAGRELQAGGVHHPGGHRQRQQPGRSHCGECGSGGSATT